MENTNLGRPLAVHVCGYDCQAGSEYVSLPHSHAFCQMNLMVSGSGEFETAFPLCFTELVKKQVISLPRLIKKMTVGPAEVIGIDADQSAEDVGKRASAIRTSDAVENDGVVRLVRKKLEVLANGRLAFGGEEATIIIR